MNRVKQMCKWNGQTLERNLVLARLVMSRILDGKESQFAKPAKGGKRIVDMVRNLLWHSHLFHNTFLPSSLSSDTKACPILSKVCLRPLSTTIHL